MSLTSKKKTLAHVVIVDDLRELCDLYTLVLKSSGYEVTFVGSSGEEVVDALAGGKLTKDNLDAVLLDYNLGEGRINGVQTAMRIKEQIPTAGIVIASAYDSIKREVLMAGFTFLLKPFSIDKLFAAMEDQQKHRRRKENTDDDNDRLQSKNNGMIL